MTLGKTRNGALGLAPPLSYNQTATTNLTEICSHDPPKGGENDGSIGGHLMKTRNAQRTIESEQRLMDYPCVCGKSFKSERGMKIHRTKMRCLDLSMRQQQRPVQTDKTLENQGQLKTTVPRKTKLLFQTMSSLSSLTPSGNESNSHLQLQTSSGKSLKAKLSADLTSL